MSETNGPGCHDCGLPYDDDGFADLVVPHDVWNGSLSPTGDEGGLLCPTCMVRAAVRAGVTCEAVFRSGPFAAEIWRPIDTAPKGEVVILWADGVLDIGRPDDMSTMPNPTHWMPRPRAPEQAP